MLTLAVLAAAALSPQDAAWIDSMLVMGRPGAGGRSTIVTDEVAYQIAQGTMPLPTDGGTFALPGGRSLTWRSQKANNDGWLEGRELQGGYAFASVESTTERVAILDATGHTMVFVNGEARAGDVYSFGFVKIPVLLKKGRNDLVFKGGRGRLRVRLVTPSDPVIVLADAPTLPDWNEGDKNPGLGGFAVMNCTKLVQRGLLQVRLDGTLSEVPVVLPPLTTVKLGAEIQAESSAAGTSQEITVSYIGLDKKTKSNSQTYTLQVKKRGDMHKRTFRSQIDDSVQYYAVQPALEEGEEKKGLILSVHGASVEATNQAAAYGRKTWAHVAAATNRSPYGFDWEDWGMKDALEVLHHARAQYNTPAELTWLTGHSMGGHGTWMLGAMHGEEFGAMGPNAGWIAFSTYGGGGAIPGDSAIVNVLNRSILGTDPRLVIRNYGNLGVFINHGGADETVPVSEAREMRKHLAEFHTDFAYYEEPGQGHWYDIDSAPGADSVDFIQLMEFLRRRPNKERKAIDFGTGNLAASSSFQWVKILQQEKPGIISRVQIREGANGAIEGTTTNIAALKITNKAIKTLKLDGQEISVSGGAEVSLIKQGGQWVVGEVPAGQKLPGFGGQFKEAFDHNFVLVYGTKGTTEENATSYARARYDAESWWYRGNGYARVIPDTDLNSVPDNSNIIVYGHKQCNAAWGALLKNSPVQVERGRVTVGEKTVTGDDLFVLTIRPKAAAYKTQVGVVAGTSSAALKSTVPLPYFLGGVHYPDLFVSRSSLIRQGTASIECAGWWGNDWSIEGGEMAWRE